LEFKNKINPYPNTQEPKDAKTIDKINKFNQALSNPSATSTNFQVHFSKKSLDEIQLPTITSKGRNKNFLFTSLQKKDRYDEH
jgi:hypothetical protein